MNATLRHATPRHAMLRHAAPRSGSVQVLAVWWPTFTFTAIGFEHSIANMWYVTIGLMVGDSLGPTFGDFLWRNLVPVVLGNFIGGAVMVGLAQFLAYDQRRGLKAACCCRRRGTGGIGIGGGGGGGGDRAEPLLEPTRSDE